MLTSTDAAERRWGELAAVSYAVSAVMAAVARRRSATPAAVAGRAGEAGG